MKYFYWMVIFVIVLLILSACGMKTGSGVFNGRLVDVSYGGLLFDTCELTFQLGEQSSSVSNCSSLSEDYCKKMQPYVGKVIQVDYDSITPWMRYDSQAICHGEVK